jgi:hypothetical protein
MSEQMDMFRERKIAQMPTSAIGKVVAVVDEEAVENMVVLLGGIYDRTSVAAHTRGCLFRAMSELNQYLGREDIVARKGA